MNHAGVRVGAALVVALSVAAFGCASTGEDEPGPPRVITFLDSERFDRQLREAFDHEYASVEVIFTGTDVTVNRVPERLDRWLSKIDEDEDTTVAVVEDPKYPKGRFAGAGVALTLVLEGYKMYRDWSDYSDADDYNATVYYVPNEGTITRITFDRADFVQRGVEAQ